MPCASLNAEDTQFTGYRVNVEMSEFSTRSYVSEDFSDMATLSEGTGELWTNTSTSIEHTASFNLLYVEQANLSSDMTNSLKLNQTGNYLALYSFTDDTVGGNPSGWTVVEDANCPVIIEPTVGGHQNVIKQLDNSPSTYPAIYQSFTAGAQNIGTIEFWLQYTKGTSSFWAITIRDGTNVKVWLDVDGANDQICNHLGTSETIVNGLSQNVWYHIRLPFDCDTDTFEFYLDGVQRGESLSFNTAADSVSRLYFNGGTGGTSGNTILRLDAIDYSWATGYETERSCWNNTYEPSGYFLSKSNLLTVGSYETYYQTLQLYNMTSQGDGSASIQWRDSDDNATWDAWSNASEFNITINANNSQYFQYCINLTASSDLVDSPEIRWVNLTYETRTFTVTDEYSDIGIIKSWYDNTQMVSALFMSVQAICETPYLKLSILSDTNNKTIEIYDATTKYTFHTDRQEFIVIELGDDYGFDYIENISCFGNPGEYYTSIVVSENISFDIATTWYDYIDWGIIHTSPSTFAFKLRNDTIVHNFYFHAEYQSWNVDVEKIESLFVNTSFRTGILYDFIYEAEIGIWYTFLEGSEYGTAYSIVYYFYEYEWGTPPTSTATTKYICFPLTTENYYALDRNISADFYDQFGINLGETYLFRCWAIDCWKVANIQFDYINFYETRDANNILINGTAGNRIISSAGTTLNLSSTCSNLQFTYIATYSLTLSGSLAWVWSSFIFTYRQLNQTCVFVNISFTDLPPWHNLYYPDNLVYYFMTALSDVDVNTFLTSSQTGVLNSTLFESYRGSASLSANDAWNFLLIVELREDPDVGTSTSKPKTTFEYAMQYFLAGVGILGAVVVGTKVVGQHGTGPTPQVIMKDSKKLRKLEEQVQKEQVANAKLQGEITKERQRQENLKRGHNSVIQKVKDGFNKERDSLTNHVQNVVSSFKKEKDVLETKNKQLKGQIGQLKKKVSTIQTQAVAEIEKATQRTAETLKEDLQGFSNYIGRSVSKPLEQLQDKVAAGAAKIENGVKNVVERGKEVGEQVEGKVKEIKEKTIVKIKKKVRRNEK